MANEKNHFRERTKMVRLIDAKPLMEDGWHLVKTGKSNMFLASMSLADAPTVDAVEVVHGRWEFVEQRFYHGGFVNLFRCSECKVATDKASNYCPNCGAKMDGVGNE